MGRRFAGIKGVDAFGKVRPPGPPSSRETLHADTMLVHPRRPWRTSRSRLDSVVPVRSFPLSPRLVQRTAPLTPPGGGLHVATGTAVTLVSLSLILALTLYEFVDYRRVHMVRRRGPSSCSLP